MDNEKDPIMTEEELAEVEAPKKIEPRKKTVKIQKDEKPAEEEPKQEIPRTERPQRVASSKGDYNPVDVLGLNDDWVQPLKKDDLTKESLEEKISKILDVPKTNNSVPTWVYYTVERRTRSVLIDIHSRALYDAWNLYKKHEGNKPVDFLMLVYKLTRKEIPRMYTAINPLELV